MQNYKTSRDDIRGNLEELRYGNDILDKTPMTWFMKVIIFKLNFFKMKKKILFCLSQCQENENTSHRLGEIFAKAPSDKGLLSKIHKEHFKFSKQL